MSPAGAHMLLLYDYVEDVLERREPHREEHLGLVRAWAADGRVVMAGPVGDPPSGAAFVFTACEPEEIGEFVARDPYVAAGLVTGWRALPWTVVVAA